MNNIERQAAELLNTCRTAGGYHSSESVIADHLDRDIWRQIEKMVFDIDNTCFDADYNRGVIHALSIMFYNNDRARDTQEFFQCMFEAFTELKYR
jgi:hypothetical protein